MINKLFLLLFIIGLDVKKYLLSVWKSEGGFALVTSPFLSMSARGTVGKALTASSWKGKQYMKKWFIPGNPKSVKQVNQRLAVTIAIAYYQSLTEIKKGEWDTAASGMQMSGANLYMRRALQAYTIQLGVTKVPASVSYIDIPPDETFTWVEAV